MTRKNHNAGQKNREAQKTRRTRRMHHDTKHRAIVLGPQSEHLVKREHAWLD